MSASDQHTLGRRGAALLACAFVALVVSLFWLCDAQPWRWMDSSVNAGLLKILL